MNALRVSITIGCSVLLARAQEVYQHQDTYYNQENDLYSVYGYGFGSSEPGSDVENDATIILAALAIGLGSAGIGLGLLNNLYPTKDIEQPVQKTVDLKITILCNLASTLPLPIPRPEICGKDHWDYKNPNEDWDRIHCLTGAHQSPIDINTSKAKKRLSFLKSGLTFSPGYESIQRGMLSNDGHSIKFTVDESNRAGISGGPLTSSYTLAQFHLHWGSRRGQGSEHTINGRAYDAELHLVHYKSSYKSFADAFDDGQPDSLAVLGIFLEEADGISDSESIKNLQEAVRRLAKTSNRNTKYDAYHNWLMTQNPSVPLTATWEKSPEFPEYLTSKFLGAPSPMVEVDVKLEDFTSDLGSDTILPFIKEGPGLYHYEGSLTTPDCKELVQWLVFDKPLKVNKNGLLKWLREIHDIDGHPIMNNYRPTQVNANTLYFYGKA